MKNLKKHKCKVKSNNKKVVKMDVRQATAEHRLSHWSEVIKERQESGLTVKAYCESIGIHTNIYYYWQKKLRAKALSEKEQPWA